MSQLINFELAPTKNSKIKKIVASTNQLINQIHDYDNENINKALSQKQRFSGRTSKDAQLVNNLENSLMKQIDQQLEKKSQLIISEIQKRPQTQMLFNKYQDSNNETAVILEIKQKENIFDPKIMNNQNGYHRKLVVPISLGRPKSALSYGAFHEKRLPQSQMFLNENEKNQEIGMESNSFRIPHIVKSKLKSRAIFQQKFLNTSERNLSKENFNRIYSSSQNRDKSQTKLRKSKTSQNFITSVTVPINKAENDTDERWFKKHELFSRKYSNSNTEILRTPMIKPILDQDNCSVVKLTEPAFPSFDSTGLNPLVNLGGFKLSVQNLKTEIIDQPVSEFQIRSQSNQIIHLKNKILSQSQNLNRTSVNTGSRSQPNMPVYTTASANRISIQDVPINIEEIDEQIKKLKMIKKLHQNQNQRRSSSHNSQNDQRSFQAPSSRNYESVGSNQLNFKTQDNLAGAAGPALYQIPRKAKNLAVESIKIKQKLDQGIKQFFQSTEGYRKQRQGHASMIQLQIQSQQEESQRIQRETQAQLKEHLLIQQNLMKKLIQKEFQNLILKSKKAEKKILYVEPQNGFLESDGQLTNQEQKNNKIIDKEVQNFDYFKYGLNATPDTNSHPLDLERDEESQLSNDMSTYSYKQGHYEINMRIDASISYDSEEDDLGKDLKYKSIELQCVRNESENNEKFEILSKFDQIINEFQTQRNSKKFDESAKFEIQDYLGSFQQFDMLPYKNFSMQTETKNQTQKEIQKEVQTYQKDKYTDLLMQMDQSIFKNEGKQILVGIKSTIISKTLTEIYRQAERQTIGKKTKMINIEKLPKEKIIELIHLNFKNMSDPFIQQKILRNYNFVMEDFYLKKKINGISFFKINEHVTKNPNVMTFMSKYEFKRLLMNISLNKTKNKIKRLLRDKIIFQTYAFIQEKYDKQFLNEDVEKQYFVNIDNYDFIDALKSCSSMFDIAEKINRNEGIYNQIDITLVKNCAEKFDKINHFKRLKLQNFNEKQEKINRVLNNHIAIPQETYDQIKVKIPIGKMLIYVNGHIRDLYLIFIPKINILSRKTQNFIERYFINMRYFHDVKQFDFRGEDLKKHYRKPTAPITKDARILPISFQQFPTYYFAYRKHRDSINNAVFQKYKNSLFTNLKKQRWDIQVREMINYLTTYWNRKVTTKDFILSKEKKAIWKILKTKFKKQDKKRHNSAPKILSDLQRINYNKIISQIFEGNKTNNLETQSLITPALQEMVAYHRSYRRNDCLTQFTGRYLESKINEKIQPMIGKVQDKIFLAYKCLELYKDNWDYEFCRNDGLSSQFGYKSQFVRDPKHNCYIMEIYEPIIIEKCQRRLFQKDTKYAMIKNKLFAKINNVFKINEDREEMYIRNELEPHNKKVKEAIVAANDFETDDEMKDIEYKEIKSDVSDREEQNENSENLKVSQGYNDYIKVLSQVETPFMHYKKLNKNKRNLNGEVTPVMGQKQSIKQDQDANSPLFTSELFEKKEIQIIDTEQLKELNIENNAYLTKIGKFKIDQMITQNQNQVEVDFIQQISLIKKKNLKFSGVQSKINKNELEIVQEVPGNNREIEVTKLIQKLKFNLGLDPNPCWNEDEIQPQSMISVDDRDSFDDNYRNLNEDDKLVVERELLISIFGKFVEHQNSEFIPESLKELETILSSELKIKERSLKDQEDSQESNNDFNLKVNVQVLSQEMTKDLNNETKPNEIISPLKKLKSYLNADQIPSEVKSNDSDFEYKQKFDDDTLSEKSENMKQVQLFKNITRSQTYKKSKLIYKMINETKKKKVRVLQKHHNYDDFITKNSLVMTHVKHVVYKITKSQNHSFYQYLCPEEQSQIHIRMNDLLIKARELGENENKTTKKKMTRFVHNNNIEGVKDQLRRYPNMNRLMFDKNGNTLVAVATCKGDMNMLKLLIKNQFDVNMPNNQGNTPLHLGIGSGNLKCIEFLLYSNVIENFLNQQGLTPFQLV